MLAKADPVSKVATTFVEVLRQRASEQPNQRAYTYLVDGETDEVALSFAEVDRDARAFAVALRDLGLSGERALLLFPPGLEFVTAFFGCLYAGVVAVPAYPPMQARHIGRVQSILRDSTPRAVLTTSMVKQIVLPMFEGDAAHADLAWIAVDQVDRGLGDRWREPEVTGDSLTFLQYTSGSTGFPKGVMVTHENLLHNEALIRLGTGTDSRSTFVGWLPLYHDMGLIGNLLHPLYVGSSCVLMSPLAFLERPLRWLHAISRYRAHTSGGPNFAYDLCARKVTPAELATLDLSSWKVAVNAAEPVRLESMERFARVFAPCGFRRESFYPCYGLAEGTLFVTGGDRDGRFATFSARAPMLERGLVAPGEGDDARTLVSCGIARLDQEVVVVHPESREICAPAEIGEIWTKSRSVAQGYWNRPEQTKETFGAFVSEVGSGAPRGPFLRTGDLGFIRDGELFVTGRLKDLIIVRGRNYYPQDLELTAETCHAQVRRGCCAAFSVDLDGEESLVVAIEVSVPAVANEVSSAVRRAVAEQHELHVHTVVLLAARSIPKTSSGKIQRHACREGFLARELAEVGRFESVVPEVTSHAITREQRRAILRRADADRRQWVEELIVRELALVLRVPEIELDRSKPLAELGLDSMMALDASDRLESNLGITLSASVLWSHPTVSAVSEYVLGAWLRTAVLELPVGKARVDEEEFDV